MRKKKDILMLCQYFHPEYISSATLPYDTANALVEAGFSVDVLCGYPKEYSSTKAVPKKETLNNLKIHRVKYLQLSRKRFVGRIINYFSFTFMILLRVFKLRKYKSIMVYSNPPILPLIAILGNILFKNKIIFVSYDVYPEIAIKTNSIQSGSVISKAMNAINKLLYQRLSGLVVLSSEMLAHLEGNRIIPENCVTRIIPNWVEDKYEQISDSSYKTKIFDMKDIRDKFVVSYFGNLGIAQDIDTIIDAIRQLKYNDEVLFIFAGHGNKMPYLKSVIKEESLENVIFFDFLQGEEFEDALKASDVFLVSLAKGLEGLAVPSKTYSYYMAGKPVIAIMDSQCDISKDLQMTESGFSVDVGNHEQLIKIINLVKDDNELKEKMSKNSRQLFKDKYTRETNTKKYTKLLFDILGGNTNV